MARNLSMNAYFEGVAQAHRPRYRFDGSTQGHWLAWKQALLPAVTATLGRMPTRVPLNPEVQAEWVEDGLVKQQVVFDVEEGLSALAYVFRPKDAKGKLPGILACHGHGAGGRKHVMGVRTGGDLNRMIDDHNADYGLEMAKAGFAVIAIDWRGFGDRDDRIKPSFRDNYGQRDPCNINYMRATMLGMTVLGMDVSDGMCALDHLCGQDFVDGGRIGAMGLSFGGTMTVWMALADQRIKAADIICYSDLFINFGMRHCNCCGSQVTPGLYELCDVPDLHGLIAPRPLLVEIGAYDPTFRVESAMACWREVEKIYAAAASRDVLDLELFEGGHAWGAGKSVDFFRKHL